MNDPRLLWFPVLSVLGWFISSRTTEAARRGVRGLSLLATVLFLVIAATGFAPRPSVAFGVHRWSAHALVIAVWLFVPFSIGVGLQRSLRGRPGLAIAQTAVLLSLLGSVFLATYTGYLIPRIGAGTSVGAFRSG